MGRNFNHFLFRLTLLSLAILVSYGVFFNFFLRQFVISIFPWLLVYFILITALSHYWLTKSEIVSNSSFINKYIIITTLRLLLNLLFIIVYLLLVKINIVSFVISFLILYLIYAVFELLTVLSSINKKKDKNLGN